MKLFQLVKMLLDDIYHQIPLSCEEEKDAAIRYELQVLRGQYPGLTNGATIDYSDPITRFAYSYRYVAAHAYTIYSLIRDTSDLSNLFDANKLCVCCLGGGPGSDLLGILKFMKMKNMSAKLMCRVYDRQEEWRETLGSVCNLLTSFDISPTFRALDITHGEAFTKYPELLHNDLFTMSFFVSEVHSKQEQAEAFFKYLFRNAKPSSLFLFVDNSSGYASSWFDKLVKAHNRLGEYAYLKSIKKPEDGYTFCMDTNEQMKDLEPYFSKFRGPGLSKHEDSGLPKSNSPVDFRIYRKV